MEIGPTFAVVRAMRARIGESRVLEATRQSLVTRLKDHADHVGWQRFFDTYGGSIRRLALRAGLSDAEADDVLQEALVSVAAEMPGFRYDPARGSFKGWLFCIARRRIADQFRRRARQRRGAEAGEAPLEESGLEPAADPLQGVWEEEWRDHCLGRAVDQVRARVAPRQWQMFELAALREWPASRVCEALGVNRAQVYMARMRVGRQLRVALLEALREEAGGTLKPQEGS